MLIRDLRLDGLLCRVESLEKQIKQILEPNRSVPDLARLAQVCERFGTNIAALKGKGRSSHLVVARSAVVRELHNAYGWTPQKLCVVLTRKIRWVYRVIR